MSEENAPDLAAIEAQVRAKVEAEFNEEKSRIIGNRDQILAEKKELEAKFKGFDQEKYAQYEEFQKRVEKDEMLKLAADGNFEELSHKLMSSQQKAWNETQSEYEERLAASQKQAEEFQNLAEELDNKYKGLQKRQYFKELVGADDSFKSDYFDDFFQLQSSKAEIDPETGAVYALEDDGKRQIDTDGNFVQFNEYYAKLKLKHGLFWNGGSGSGIKTGKGDGGMDIKSMSIADRAELRRQVGDAKYAEMVRNQK